MKRNHEIKVRLNDDEFNDLNGKVIKSKLSREEYIRRCFSKSLIKEPPDLDYFRLKNEFNHIGNNLNQIAKRVNETSRIYDADIDCLKENQEKIWSAANGILTRLANIK